MKQLILPSILGLCSWQTCEVLASSRFASSQQTSMASPQQALVVSKYRENVGWLKSLPSGFDSIVYQSGNESAPNFVPNVGNEAYKYLEYIVDNFENLPATITFVHAGRQEWHDPRPKDVSIPELGDAFAAAHGGFAYLPGVAPETCWSVSLSKRPNGHSRTNEGIPVEVARPVLVDVLHHLWHDVLENDLGPAPDHWCTACCAQFQVLREAIQRHPVSFYKRLLDWVRDNDTRLLNSKVLHLQGRPASDTFLKTRHDQAGRDAGQAMELIWPLIFTDFQRMKKLVWKAAN
jgi:hypothetical protein